jgi:ankyrin repeat protein
MTQRSLLVWVRATLIGLALGLLFWLYLTWQYTLPPHFTPYHIASFEWDSVHGFKAFRLEDSGLGNRVGGRLWRYVVALQIKPGLDYYLRHEGTQRAKGTALVKVVRIIPIALPGGWGSDGLSFKDPEEPALTRAAASGDADTVRKLLREGVDVNTRNQWGQTALFLACSYAYRNAELIKVLLDAGADPNVRERWGGTVLVSAVGTASDENRPPIVRELLRSHADVNVKDSSGMTPLMRAAFVGDVETVRILLGAGADANVSDHGETALKLARWKGHRGVMQVLEQAGARE